MDLYWLINAIAYWFLVLFLVPTKYIMKFLLFSVLGGFVYTWIVQLIAVQVLDSWQFKPDILTIWGIPFFFTFSWAAVTLVFGYLLYRYPKNQLWIIIFFVLWGTAMSYYAAINEKITFLHWTNPESLLFAVFSHVLLLYGFKYLHRVDELGAKEDIFDFSLGILKSKKD